MRSKVVILFAVFISIFSLTFAGTPSQTVNNLKEAIIGETTASAKYAAYAEKADEEGYKNIAALFRAASKAESIHANNHRAVLDQLGETMENFSPKYNVSTTKANLQDAIKGEGYEVTTMYPEFLQAAKNDNVNLALISFNYAYQTEKKHGELYKNALAQLQAGNESTLASEFYICSTCGNTYENDAPERCGISMTPKERFLVIN